MPWGIALILGCVLGAMICGIYGAVYENGIDVWEWAVACIRGRIGR